MKKFFLIPVLALFTCVSAWAGNVFEAGDFAALKNALTNAANNPADKDTIKLTANIDYGQVAYGSNLNITKSIVLDGQNHTLKGGGQRQSGNSTYATVWININGSSDVDVVFKDIKIINGTSRDGQGDMAIQTRGKLRSLTLKNVYLESPSIPLQIGGNHTGLAYTTDVTIEDSHLKALNYYALLTWNKFNLVATDSKFEGWAGLYFKGPWSSVGSRGTVVNATRCDFECFNKYSGESNAFGALVCEDDGITITATNCKMNSSAYGDQAQSLLLASGRSDMTTSGGHYMRADRRTQPISLTIAGDNSQIIMEGRYYQDGDHSIDVKAVQTFNNNTWYNGGILFGSDDYIVPFSVTMTGGTYDVNPYYYRHVTGINRDGDGNPIMTEDGYSVVAQSPIIPAGYAVVEVEDGGKTRYRIIHSDISYDINGQYETAEAGENPTTSFIVEAASADQTIELVNNATEASYVQVRDNTGGDAVTLAVGKEDGEGNPVNQTLIVNNGLDVQGNSQVVVQSGSTLQIGEGGIVTSKPENIVIEADETGAASLIMDPAITVNQTPNLTVKMLAKGIGRDSNDDYYWHRFAMPVAAGITSWEKVGNLTGSTYPTYIYDWDYTNNDWRNLPNGVADMEPLQGYTLTLASNYIHVDEGGNWVSDLPDGNLRTKQDVTYIFKGNLVGNTDQPLAFTAEGFNFFGNSYTGYIDVLTLIQGFVSENVEGTVYMWCNDPDDEDGNYQSYVGISLKTLNDAAAHPERVARWKTEVAPMQTFILRLRGANSADETVSYADAIWGNPRYGHSTTSTAPRRVALVNNEEAYFEVSVKAANGKGSRIDFTQDANHNDAFESGYDVVKFMNERTINLYSTINGEDFSSVVTNTLNGKLLSLQTNEEVNYTMSFKNVEGTEYAILDHATNQLTVIAEGNTYQFAAQPNSTVDGRFEIVNINRMPTAIENTEVKANVKGIYTITGQYVGENFETLPAGVYVVDGVKIVK